MNQTKSSENSTASRIIGKVSVLFLKDGTVQHEFEGAVSLTEVLAARSYLDDLNFNERFRVLGNTQIGMLQKIQGILEATMQAIEKTKEDDTDGSRDSTSDNDVSVLLPPLQENAPVDQEVDGEVPTNN